jgi:hypothetical protein
MKVGLAQVVRAIPRPRTWWTGRIHTMTAVLAMSVFGMHAGHAQDTVRPPSRTADAGVPSWIVGCWSAADGSDSREYWFAAGSDALVGVGRSVRAGRLAGYEFMVIRTTPAGLSFTAKPAGQAEATFLAVTVAAREVVFENAAHDFPQRVIYRSASAGTLSGRIEGTENGTQRAIDYPMIRTSCE